MKSYRHFSDLGVPTFHPPVLDWRRPRHHEIESGELIGKKFKTSRGKEFICKNIDKEHVHFYNIKMEIRFSRFLLPVEKQLTLLETINWLKENRDVKDVICDTMGCQLHGDMDATIIFNNGTKARVPLNY